MYLILKESRNDFIEIQEILLRRENLYNHTNNCELRLNLFAYFPFLSAVNFEITCS